MPASYEILYELLTPVALAFWLMGSGVFLPSGLVLFTFSYNYYDVLRLMNILILRYNLSCTMGRYEGKPVIFITGESVAKLLADLINLPTLFILVQKQYTDIFKNKLFICDHSADHTGNPWQLLNTTAGVVYHRTDSIIFNIESLYNKYSNSTPEKFPRQGNNQQNKKLINLSTDPSVTSSDELLSEIIVIAQGGKNYRYNRAFIEWFIGFTEGDGSFVMSTYASFSIHLHKVDLPLLYVIKTELNMGNIYSYRDSVHFHVRDKRSIAILISIFKGKLFLTKCKSQFQKWVDIFLTKNPDMNGSVSSTGSPSLSVKDKYINSAIREEFKPTHRDNWIAGFIEAEGSFIVSITNKKIPQRMVLIQKDAESELSYLSHILGGYTEKDKKGVDRWVVYYTNLSSLIDYLNTRNLYSVKAGSFAKWMEIFYFRKNNTVINDVQLKELKKKAAFVNSIRKIK